MTDALKGSSIRSVLGHLDAHGVLLEVQRAAALGLLAAGVVHDVNNAMACVLTNLGYVADRLVGHDLDPSLVDALEEAKEAAEKARSIAASFRPMAQRSGPRLLDVRETLERCLRLIRTELAVLARVDRHYEPVPDVTFDEDALAQLLVLVLAWMSNQTGGPLLVSTASVDGGLAVHITMEVPFHGGQGAAPGSDVWEALCAHFAAARGVRFHASTSARALVVHLSLRVDPSAIVITS